MSKSGFRGALILLTIMAAGTSASAQQKVGFVDVLGVIAQTAEGQARIGAWNEFSKTKQESLNAEATELQNLRQQFAEQQLTLNPETRAEMQRSIEDKTTSLQRLSEDFERERAQRRNVIMQDMLGKLRTLLSEYGKENGFAAIFIRNDQQVFVADALDLTPQILALYDQKHPTQASGSGDGGGR